METNTSAIDWRALLEDEVAKAGEHGKARVAVRLGVSRAYVSRVMNPNGKSALKNVPEKFIRRVIERFHTVQCPFTFQETHRSVCNQANQPAPIHNPLAVQKWRVCQSCQFKPAPDVDMTASSALQKPARKIAKVGPVNNEIYPQQAGVIDKVTLPLPEVGGPLVEQEEGVRS